MMVEHETEHFELLKNIWKKKGVSNDGINSLEHIEDLNLMVGQIRNNIQSLIKF